MTQLAWIFNVYVNSGEPLKPDTLPTNRSVLCNNESVLGFFPRFFLITADLFQISILFALVAIIDKMSFMIYIYIYIILRGQAPTIIFDIPDSSFLEPSLWSLGHIKVASG